MLGLMCAPQNSGDDIIFLFGVQNIAFEQVVYCHVKHQTYLISVAPVDFKSLTNVYVLFKKSIKKAV